jgi:hypothetical protein
VSSEPLCVVIGGSDRAFDEVIAPAVRDAGMEPVHGDAGPFARDGLVLADFAVVDLSDAAPELYCALGARYALRAHATVALPAEAHDRAEITAALVAARERAVPAFRLIDDVPSDIARLKTDTFRERARYSPECKTQLDKARARGEQAVRAVERQLGALEGVEAGVLIDLMLSYRAVGAWMAMLELIDRMPLVLRRTTMVREQAAFALNRAGRGDEARAVLLALIAEQGASSETYGLLGRVHKDRWEAVRDGDVAAAREHLDAAIDAYRRGFEADWRDAYPGVNAVTLMEIREPGGGEQRELVPVVRYANARRIEGEPDYWDYATRLELAVVAREREAARAAARAALAAVREPWEPESTAYNLSLIREARAASGERLEWVDAIERELRAGD